MNIKVKKNQIILDEKGNEYRTEGNEILSEKSSILTEGSNDKDKLEFYSALVPVSEFDLDSALSTAKNGFSDKNYAEKLGDLCIKYINEFSISIEDLQPEDIAMNYILSVAKTEIKKLTKYDIQDSKQTEYNVIDVASYGDFDYTEDAVEKLQDILESNNIKLNSLSNETQYLLDAIGIDLE